MFAAKTDAELCKASSAGQPEAFEELVRRYQGAVCAVTYAATGRRDLSEDLAQETFLIAWKKLSGIEAPDRVGGWLVGIARNLARKSHRTRSDLPLEDLEALGSEETGMEETVLEHESRAQVWALLQTLPLRYREVLVLYYREGQSASRVAEQLGISRSATEQRLSRGRRLLREKFERALERELSRTAPSPAFARKVAAALPMAPIATGTSAGTATRLTPWIAGLGKAIVMKKIIVAVAAVAIVVLGYGVFASGESPQPASEPSPSSQGRAAARRSEPTRTTKTESVPAGIEGTVVLSGTTTPMTAAVVTITTRRGEPGFVRGQETVPAITRVDAQGAFSLEGLSPGRYIATANAPGHRLEQPQRFEVRSGDVTTGVTLSLKPGGIPLTGVATDVGGGPVAGAVIRAEHRGQVLATFTDEQGRYALSVPRGSNHVLVWDDDYEREDRYATVNGPRTIDFQLVPAATIRGRVVERESGTPVVGAIVAFGMEVRNGKSFSSRSARDDEKVISGPDGSFTLRRLSAADYKVYAHASHLATGAPAHVTVGIAEQVDGLVVTMDPAFNVRGRVVDATDASIAISGARVSAFGNPNRSPEVITADDGTFELVGIQPGNHPLSVAGDGFVASMMEASVTVEDTDVDGLEVEVERGVQVRGRLVPPQAANVTVKLRDGVGGFEVMLKGRKLRAATTEADENGEFSIGTVPAGDWKLVATAKDGSRGELEISVPAEGLNDAVLSLNPRPSLRGRVVRSDGETTAGLTVRLVAAVSPGHAVKALRARNEAKTASADETGAFELVGLESGSYELEVVDSRGVAWARTAADSTKLPVELTENGVDDVVLEVDAPAGSIAGVVKGPDGPLADAWVSLYTTDDSGLSRERPTTVSDADGRFEFDNLPDGTYELSATSDHRDATGNASKVSVGDEVELVLESLCTVAGSVTFDGRPVRQFEVDAGRIDRRFLAEDGRFSMSGVTCGTTVVVVNAKEGSIRHRLELDVGDEADLELDLRTWASVTGRAVYPDGSPAAGVQLSWHMQAGERDLGGRVAQELAGGQPRTGDDGTFRIDGLGAGRGRIRLGGRNLLGKAALRGEIVLFAEPGEVVDLGDIEIRGGEPVADEDRGVLGCSVRAATEAPSADGWHPGPNGRPGNPLELWVSDVTPSGIAAKAGLEVGQKIVAVNGKTVEDVGATALAVGLSDGWVESGRTYALEVETDSGSKTVQLTAIAQN